MNQQKGFSLIEVLLSLMLTATVALALLQLQVQAQCFLTKLVMRIEESHLLDNGREQKNSYQPALASYESSVRN